jgi:hypothetical protein
MKVSTEIDNNFGYEKITQLVDNIPLMFLFVRHTSFNLTQDRYFELNIFYVHNIKAK